MHLSPTHVLHSAASSLDAKSAFTQPETTAHAHTNTCPIPLQNRFTKQNYQPSGLRFWMTLQSAWALRLHFPAVTPTLGYWTCKPIICARPCIFYQKWPEDSSTNMRFIDDDTLSCNLQESDVHLGPLYICSQLMKVPVAFVSCFLRFNPTEGKVKQMYIKNIWRGLKWKAAQTNQTAFVTCFSVYQKRVICFMHTGIYRYTALN